MSSGLSVLYVTTRFPLPLWTGDRARAFHQLRLLAARHRLTLVTYADDTATPEARSRLEAFGVRVVTVPFSARKAAFQVGRGLWSGLPLQVALFDSQAARAAVRSLVASERFDVAHVQLARAVPLVDASLGLPRVVDLIDALSLNMRSRAVHDRGPLRWAARVDAARLLRYERRICAEADAALVVAQADREAIGGERPPIVNSNGVDLAAFPHVAGPRAGRRLVFTGNLGYFANVDAVCWFAEHVLPLVWRDAPDATFTIAGARPHARVLALAGRDARITVAGQVGQMHPVLATARVSVAPMRAGSGQLLKVLEAMAAGTPVVATSRALSGIDATAGEHALVADSPDAFAARVVDLLRDDELGVRLGRAGRGLVERLYSWDRSVGELERVYHQVVGCARTARTA
jgi:polysaccharide biosynthesis protein PslH